MGSFFSKSTVWSPATNMPDLHGKVVIVTGGNAGIGEATVKELARHGAKVYMAARTEKRALAALDRFYKENPSVEQGSVVWLPLELSDFESVTKAAQMFLMKEERLDILVNNAGMGTHSFQTTPQGFEMTFGVNHLGHFLFTNLLLPILKTTAARKDSDVRIVTTSSSGHTMLIPSTMNFDKQEDFKYPGVSSPNYTGMRDMFSRYALSKLANILFASELQRRFDAEDIPIISTSFNPGGINTEGGMSVWPAWLRPIMSLIFAPPETGAVPALYLATAKEVREGKQKLKGGYFDAGCQIQMPSKFAQDPVKAKNLWELSEKAVEGYLKGNH